MITDELIKKKLSKKEARELLYLNKKYAIPGVSFIVHEGRTEKYFQNLRGNLETCPKGSLCRERTEHMVRCLDLYEKVSDDPKEILLHWHIAWETQREIKNSYKKMAKPPRQDNKTYINRGNGRGYLRDVRRPRKNRKTAWKRFYKLFPELKPQDES